MVSLTRPRDGRAAALSTRGRRRLVLGFGDQALSSLSNAAISVFAAATLSAHDFGTISLIFAVYLVANGTVRSITSDVLIVRFANLTEAGAWPHVRDALTVSAVTGSVIGAVIAASGVLVGGATASALYVLGAAMPALALQDSMRFGAMSVRRPDLALANDGIWFVTAVTGVSLLIATGRADLVTVTAVWAGSGAAAALIIAAVSELRPGGTTQPTWDVCRSWLRDHRDLFPQFTADLYALQAAGPLSIFIVAAVEGAPAAGAIRAAQLPFNVLTVFLNGARLAVVPELVRALHVSASAWRRVLAGFTVALGLAAIAWSAIVLGLPYVWMSKLFGRSWAAADHLLLPTSVAILAISVSAAFFVGIRSLADATAGLRARLLSAVAIVLCIFIGARLGGPYSAAVWLAIGASIGAGICAVQLRVSWRSWLARGGVETNRSVDETQREMLFDLWHELPHHGFSTDRPDERDSRPAPVRRRVPTQTRRPAAASQRTRSSARAVPEWRSHRARDSVVVLLFLLLANMQSIAGLLAPAALAVYVLSGLARGRISARVPLATLGIVTYLVYLIAVTAVQHSTANLSWLAFIPAHGQIIYMLVVLLLFMTVREGGDAAFYRAYLVAAGIVALLGAVSVFVHPLSLNGTNFSAGSLPSGPLSGHDPFSALLGNAALLGLGAFLLPEGDAVLGRRRGWLRTCAVLVAVMFVVGQSRGYLLGAAVAAAGLIVVTVLRESRDRKLRAKAAATWLIGPLIAGGALAMLYHRLVGISTDTNVTTRYDLWAQAWTLFKQSPIIGAGLGAFEQVDLTVRSEVGGIVALRTDGYYPTDIVEHAVAGGLHAHEVYLQFLAETGLVGLLGILAILVAGWRAATRVLRNPSSDDITRFSARLVHLCTAYLAVAGLTAGYTFSTPTTALLLYFAWSRVFRASMPARRARYSAGPAHSRRAIVRTPAGAAR